MTADRESLIDAAWAAIDDRNDVDVGLRDLATAAVDAVLNALSGADDDLPLSMLHAGKDSLFSCSEDPQIEDARKCFFAMLAALPKEPGT